MMSKVVSAQHTSPWRVMPQYLGASGSLEGATISTATDGSATGRSGIGTAVVMNPRLFVGMCPVLLSSNIFFSPPRQTMDRIVRLQDLLTTMKSSDAFTAAEIKCAEQTLASMEAECERLEKAAEYKANVVNPDLKRLQQTIATREAILNASGIDDLEILKLFREQHQVLQRDQRTLEAALNN